MRMKAQLARPRVQHHRHAQPCRRCVSPSSSSVSLADPKSAPKISRGACWASARSSLGSVKTTWKWRTESNRSVRAAIHFSCRKAWHLGQCRLRQELYAGCSKPHERHTSTCPPSSAVRHRAIAESTLRCASERHISDSSAVRCCRTISPMSKRGLGRCRAAAHGPSAVFMVVMRLRASSADRAGSGLRDERRRDARVASLSDARGRAVLDCNPCRPQDVRRGCAQYVASPLDARLQPALQRLRACPRPGTGPRREQPWRRRRPGPVHAQDQAAAGSRTAPSASRSRRM